VRKKLSVLSKPRSISFTNGEDLIAASFVPATAMGAHKKTRKFQVKKIIGQRDARLKKNQETGKTAADAQKKKSDDVIREA
jgi:hypothetical protein